MAEPIGIFSMMAVMTTIIAGSTGIRLLFIDAEYRRIVNNMKESYKVSQSENKELRSDSMLERRRKRLLWLSYAKDLSGMRRKRASNNRNVIWDGIVITVILCMGFVTALDNRTNLYVVVSLSLLLFLSRMTPFYFHAHSVITKYD